MQTPILTVRAGGQIPRVTIAMKVIVWTMLRSVSVAIILWLVAVLIYLALSPGSRVIGPELLIKRAFETTFGLSFVALFVSSALIHLFSYLVQALYFYRRRIAFYNDRCCIQDVTAPPESEESSACILYSNVEKIEFLRKNMIFGSTMLLFERNRHSHKRLAIFGLSLEQARNISAIVRNQNQKIPVVEKGQST